jgi:hypothetical protein
MGDLVTRKSGRFDQTVLDRIPRLRPECLCMLTFLWETLSGSGRYDRHRKPRPSDRTGPRPLPPGAGAAFCLSEQLSCPGWWWRQWGVGGVEDEQAAGAGYGDPHRCD